MDTLLHLLSLTFSTWCAGVGVVDGSGVNNATKRTDGFGHDDSRNWTFVDRFAFASQDGNWNIKMKITARTFNPVSRTNTRELGACPPWMLLYRLFIPSICACVCVPLSRLCGWVWLRSQWLGGRNTHAQANCNSFICASKLKQSRIPSFTSKGFTTRNGTQSTMGTQAARQV